MSAVTRAARIDLAASTTPLAVAPTSGTPVGCAGEVGFCAPMREDTTSSISAAPRGERRTGLMTKRWVWVGGDLVAIADLDSRSHIKVGSPSHRMLRPIGRFLRRR